MPPSPEPDKAFFERNPRAALLRNICIEAIGASRSMISSEGEDRDSFERLIDINQALMSLGVEPSVHTIAKYDPDGDEKRRKLISEPVTAAEWIAGQVRSLLISTAALTTTTNGLSARLQEHDELSGQVEGVYMSGHYVPETARDIGVIGLLASMLDYDAGPSDPEKLR